MTSEVRVGSGGGERTLGEVRAALVRRLRARRAEIEEAIVAGVRDGVSDLEGAGDAAHEQGLRAAVTALLDYGLDGIERARQPAGARRTRAAVAKHPAPVAVETQQTRAAVAAHPAPVMAETQRARAAVAAHPAPVVAGTQRARIIRAMTQVAGERGFADTTVALVIARAKVSSRTFYGCFDGLEECLVAVLYEGLERVGALVSQALEGAQSWRDGIRAALAAVLGLFDSEPELARACMVETLAAGPTVREHRERVDEAFRALVVARIQSEVSHASPLAPEAALASVVGIVGARLSAHERAPLIELLGPLMGVIVGPFVDEAEVALEIERSNGLARAIGAGGARWGPPPPNAQPERALSGMLGNPGAHRARECVRFLAAHPDRSNREIATAIGVTQKSQISTLLSCLLAEDAVSKHSEGPGKRNAWRLTPRGERLARALAEQESRAPRSSAAPQRPRTHAI
jgi:AcrR family transcriptional regulator